MTKKASWVAVLVVVLATAGAARANIVTNPGFETGDFSGWTNGGDTSFTDVHCSDSQFPSYAGNCAAVFGPFNSDGTLTQILSTIAGGTYDLSFRLQYGVPDGEGGLSGGTPNDFSVSWNGAALTSLVDSPEFFYQLFVFSGLSATSGSTSLQFTFLSPPSFWLLDEVIVDSAVSTVPEPASLLLFGSGLVGLALGRRRKSA